jgi:hypothetical protein
MSNIWAAAVEVGFLGWVGATIGFIFRAINKENRFVGKKALFWGVLIGVFYTVWIVGLVKA